MTKLAAVAPAAQEVALARKVWAFMENLPVELEGGRLMMSEKLIRTQLPIPLSGIVDQLYETSDSLVVPVDTKSRFRHRVKAGDVIQLSVYRFILRYGAEYASFANRVARYGYVRVERPGGSIEYLRTPLLDDRQVVSVYLRWLKLREGRAENVVFEATPRNCMDCVVRSDCGRRA